MAFWEDLTKALGGGWSSNLLVGAAVVILAPVVVPGVLALARPMAKAAIKSGMFISQKAGEMVAEASEQMSDLVAEARAELATSAAATATGNTQGSS